MSQSKGMSLSGKILTAMGIGVLVGVLINQFASDVQWIQTYIVFGLFEAVATASNRPNTMYV